MKLARSQKGSLLIRLGVCGFAIYVGFTLVTLQMEMNVKKTELAAVELQIEEQRLASKELERQIAMGEDSSYLARIARDKLDLAFPDEFVYRDASGA